MGALRATARAYIALLLLPLAVFAIPKWLISPILRRLMRQPVISTANQHGRSLVASHVAAATQTVLTSGDLEAQLDMLEQNTEALESAKMRHGEAAEKLSRVEGELQNARDTLDLTSNCLQNANDETQGALEDKQRLEGLLRQVVLPALHMAHELLLADTDGCRDQAAASEVEQRIVQAFHHAARVLSSQALADSQSGTPFTSTSGMAAAPSSAGPETGAGGGNMPRSASQALNNSAGLGRATGLPRAASLGRFASPAKPVAAVGEGCSAAKKVLSFESPARSAAQQVQARAP